MGAPRTCTLPAGGRKASGAANLKTVVAFIIGLLLFKVILIQRLSHTDPC